MPLVIPVRMHFSAQDLWFSPGSTGASAGDHVIVSTERGTEIGLATSAPFDAPKSEVKGDLKPVLRIATDEDLARADELAEQGDAAMPVFRELIKAHELDMKPVGIEFLFGGEKAVFYFAAEERIDFRELVRDLASRFHTRVDMRQIGVRDEVRLIGGFAPCGQELCCARFGGKFEPVSIRMAKEQDLPLNSAKISGMCGRLMCCLRYEFEAYKDFKTRAPKRNALIDTPLGKAKIVEYNTPRETITMRLENGKSFTVPLADMTCSDACRKRCEQQGSPLRPDTVSRDALEALGTAEIMAQLADLDRQNNPEAYELDSSLLSPRARRSSRADTASGASMGSGASKRSRAGASGAASGRGGAQASADERRGEAVDAASTDRPAGRKGMRPRRQSTGRAGTDTQVTPGSGSGGQRRGKQDAPSAAGRAGADRGQQPRRQSAPAGARSGGAPAADAASTGGRQQPQKRVRRHHTVSDAPAAASAPETTRAARPETTPAPRPGNTPKRTRGDSSQSGGSGEGGAPRARRQHVAPQGGDQTPRTRRGRADAEAGSGQNQGADAPQRRRRRPGDKGGAGTGASAPQK